MTNPSGELARWRFAARLARREVLRRPWRSLLVVLLVAVPVGGMTIFSVVTRSANDALTWAPVAGDGRTDLYVSSSLESDFELGQYLPDGSTTAAVVSGWAAVETTSATIDAVQFSDGNGFGTGSVVESEGRSPRPGEVWLSTELAEQFGVGIGDTLTLRHPEGRWTVAGTGRNEGRSNERLIVMPDLPVGQFRPDVLQLTTLVDLPDGTTAGQVELIGQSIRNSLQPRDGGVSGWAYWDEAANRDDSIAPLAWTWVLGTLALAAMGIVIAAAFATSARRQLVTIGLLSSNGSSECSIRRMLALQGAWTGLAGSILGLGLGIVVLVAFRSFFEAREGALTDDYEFGALYLFGIVATGVVAATVAAMVPAKSASKVPVMAALAGRRPLGSVPPRLVRRGLAFAAVGALLLVVGALSRDGGVIPSVAATVGGLFVIIGMCLCSPLAVDWTGRASGRLTGSWRLAGRSLGRTRTRSAAVVTAVAVIGALTTAGAATADVVADSGVTRTLPRDAIVLMPNRELSVRETDTEIDYAPAPSHPVDEATKDTIDAIVPSAVWHERRVATWDPAPFAIAADGSWLAGMADVELAVADDAMMDLYELNSDERARLRDVGVLAVSPHFGWMYAGGVPSERPLLLATEQGEIGLEYSRRDFLDPLGTIDYDSGAVMYGIDGFLITEEAARGAGLDIVTRGAFLRSAGLTNEQRSEAQNAIYGTGQSELGQYYRDVPMPTARETVMSVIVDWPGTGMTPESMQGILVALAFVLTLLVVAIGLALAAAEAVNERDVLVAVGGRPATMRAMAGARATVLTFTGVALAVPFGLLPMFAVMRATGHRFEVPWLVVSALLVPVPALAGGSAWLVSAIAQRIRPVRISNLAFD